MCRLSLVAASGGYSLVAVCGLLTVVASLVAKRALFSLVVVCRLLTVVASLDAAPRL